MKKLSLISLIGIMVLAGCGATTSNVGTLTLPTSGKIVDVVQHRTSTYDGCAELVVLQTYSADGTLINSEAGRGRTLGCTVVEVGIEAGSRVGSAAIIGNAMVKAAKATHPDNINVDNELKSVNTNVNKQTQSQNQHSIFTGPSNPPSEGGSNGHGDKHPNNGFGNGGGDGVPGHSHHEDNNR